LSSFPNVASALGWATEYVACWRSGRSFSPDVDTHVPGKVRRSGGISNDAADALDIVHTAAKVCSGHSCPLYPRSLNGTGREMCLFLYLFPDPTERKPVWKEPDRQRFEGCLCQLERALQRRRLVD